MKPRIAESGPALWAAVKELNISGVVPPGAAQLLEIARALNVPGVLVKKFKREELRAYALPGGWENTRIRAVPELHFVG